MVHQVREIKIFEEIWRYAQNTKIVFFETTIFNKSYLEHAKSYDAAIGVLGYSKNVVADGALTTL